MGLVKTELQALLKCKNCLLYNDRTEQCHLEPTAVPADVDHFCSHCALVVAEPEDLGKIEELRRTLAPEVYDGGDDEPLQ